MGILRSAATLLLLVAGLTSLAACRQTAASPPHEQPRRFSIEVRYYDESYSAPQKEAFAEAEALWERVIVGDVVDVRLAKPENYCSAGEPAVDETIDDVIVFATSFTEEAGGLLGYAGPCISRSLTSSDTATTVLGVMSFDTADLDALAASGNLVEVIAHELGHVLGIGATWEAPALGVDLLEYTTNPPGQECRYADAFLDPPEFVGANGVAVWQGVMSGSGDVPVEETGGEGTQCAHWDDATFGNELMTGYLNFGVDNPLSLLSVRSLVDINYEVDDGAAQPYTRPGDPAPLLRGQGVDIGASETVLRPRGAVDPETGEIAPLH